MGIIKTTGIVVGVVALVGAGLVLTNVISVGVNVLTAPGRVINQTLDTNNIVYNYEWFKQQYQDIQAIGNKLANSQATMAQYISSLPEDRSKWSFEVNQEFNRLNSIILGLSNQRQDMIATYNARANMVNRSIFMGSDVPDQITN